MAFNPRRKAARKFTGSEPTADGWGAIASVTAEHGEWAIYWRETVGDSRWNQVKVLALQPVPNKGNYWIAYGYGRDGEYRLAANKESAAMAEHRPELLAQVLGELDAYREEMGQGEAADLL